MRGETTPEVREAWCETKDKDDKTVLHGPYRAWYPDGVLGTKGQYIFGKAQGLWEAWYENGEKEAEGYYVDGLKIGEWHYWDKQGNRVSEASHDVTIENVITIEDQFSFNIFTAVDLSINAMKKYTLILPDPLHFEQFDTNNPIVKAIYSIDYDGNEKKVVVVVFPSKSGSQQYAYVYSILKEDGSLEVHTTAYTILPIEHIIRNVLTGRFWEGGI